MSLPLAIGSPVPSFNVLDSKGKEVASQLLIGHPFVLYFYPKDNTPGCTTEACDFRDMRDQLNELGAPVFGVSTDSDTSHNQFIEKHHLNFSLISDPSHSLCSLFGAWGEKKSFGKTGWGIIRSTFVFDHKGILRFIESPVKVDGHAERVFQALEAISKN